MRIRTSWVQIARAPFALAALLGHVVVAQPTPGYPAMTNEGANHMVSTFGFYAGQSRAVEGLARMYPDLAVDLRRAAAQFDLAFGRSVSNIDAVLQAELPSWEASREVLLGQIAEQVDPSGFSRAQAEASVVELEARARGEIPSPFLETLLIYHPDFIRHPSEELVRGYRETYRTGDHPKAKGVDFQVEVPRSWAHEEGRRPNVIVAYESQNGRGPAYINLMVKDIPVEEDLSGLTWDDVMGEGPVGGMGPPGSEELAVERIVLDGLPGEKSTYSLEVARLDQTVYGLGATYAVLYEGKFIMLHCMVGDDAPDGLPDLFERYEPLFDLIANSLVIQSRWE